MRAVNASSDPQQPSGDRRQPGEPQEQLEPSVGAAPVEPPGFRPYHHPAAGWGAARSVTELLASERVVVDGSRAILRMNA